MNAPFSPTDLFAGPPGWPLVFAGVSVSAGAVPVLRPASLVLPRGGVTALVGPNGAGKSSLIRLAMGLLEPSAGRIRWGAHGEDAPPRRALVLQRPVMLRRSVRDNVLFALEAAGYPASARPARSAALLKEAGLADRAAQPARRLSGGEQQRLALARALARDPDLLLLDEPTASLDPAATRAVEAIVARVAARGTTLVMATHDLGQARRLATRILFMVAGRIVEDAPSQTFFTAPTTAEARSFLAGELVISPDPVPTTGAPR